MMKTKCIVMRTSAKLTVIFTEKGDFLEIPTPKEPPKLGQTIEVLIKSPRIPSFRNSWLKYSTTAAVLLLILSITVSYLLFIPKMVVASVALDINNGIELFVNNQGKVIKIGDVNGSSRILEGISIKGLGLYQAVDLIVDNANNKGLLAETQNLVLASVVPINRWGNQLIDTDILRNTIRDEMVRRSLSGSVVVGQTTLKIQQEAQQQAMTVNSYLIYDRCKEQGFAVRPDSLRNNVKKALADAHVSISSLFPGESLEVKVQNRKDNSEDIRHESNDQKASEHNQSSSGVSETTENHSNSDHSKSQSQSSAGVSSNSGNETEPDDSNHSPVSQPSHETSHDSTASNSELISPDHRTQESFSREHAAPSYGGSSE